MAIEDAVSIAQLLPESTSASEVPDRLKLYESIRHERATHVQEQTRINGLDEDKRPASRFFENDHGNRAPSLYHIVDQGGFTMLVYCHSHDESQHSREKLEEHLKAKSLANGVTNGA